MKKIAQDRMRSKPELTEEEIKKAINSINDDESLTFLERKILTDKFNEMLQKKKKLQK